MTKRQFTDKEVRFIRRLAHQNIPYSIIADNVLAPYATVYNAARGITYGHINNPPPVGPRDPTKSPHANDGRPRCGRCHILSKNAICNWCRDELDQTGQNEIT